MYMSVNGKVKEVLVNSDVQWINDLTIAYHRCLQSHITKLRVCCKYSFHREKLLKSCFLKLEWTLDTRFKDIRAGFECISSKYKSAQPQANKRLIHLLKKKFNQDVDSELLNKKIESLVLLHKVRDQTLLAAGYGQESSRFAPGCSSIDSGNKMRQLLHIYCGLSLFGPIDIAFYRAKQRFNRHFLIGIHYLRRKRVLVDVLAKFFSRKKKEDFNFLLSSFNRRKVKLGIVFHRFDISKKSSLRISLIRLWVGNDKPVNHLLVIHIAIKLQLYRTFTRILEFSGKIKEKSSMKMEVNQLKQKPSAKNSVSMPKSPGLVEDQTSYSKFVGYDTNLFLKRDLSHEDDVVGKSNNWEELIAKSKSSSVLLKLNSEAKMLGFRNLTEYRPHLDLCHLAISSLIESLNKNLLKHLQNFILCSVEYFEIIEIEDITQKIFNLSSN